MYPARPQRRTRATPTPHTPDRKRPTATARDGVSPTGQHTRHLSPRASRSYPHHDGSHATRLAPRCMTVPPCAATAQSHTSTAPCTATRATTAPHAPHLGAHHTSIRRDRTIASRHDTRTATAHVYGTRPLPSCSGAAYHRAARHHAHTRRSHATGASRGRLGLLCTASVEAHLPCIAVVLPVLQLRGNCSTGSAGGPRICHTPRVCKSSGSRRAAAERDTANRSRRAVRALTEPRHSRSREGAIRRTRCYLPPTPQCPVPSVRSPG
jgi:hypothetical protein